MCKNLTYLKIPKKVTYIGESAFYGCESLTSIVIPDGIASIEEHTFDGCKNLTSVTLPKTVTFISDYAFWGCENLTSIDIPDEVCHLGMQVFQWSGLTSVKIPKGVSIIPSVAFQWCGGLKSVAIPIGVKKVERGAFQDTSIEDVYYEGSESQWSKIEIEADNDILKNATMHYATTEPDVPNPDDTEKPNTSDPTTSNPVASDPTESDTSGSTTSNPDTSTPDDTSGSTSGGTSEPTTSNPTTSEPNESEPTTSEPPSSDTSEDTSSDKSDTTSSDTSDDTSSDTSDDTSSNTSDTTSTPTGDGEITKDVQIGDGAPNAEVVTPMGSLLDAVLTAEELEQYKNGADIKITITSNDISSSVTSADMRAVKNALSGFFGYNVGIYVDMRIFKSVSGRVNSVHDLNSPITVRIEAPENLRKIGREFIVVRVHDGKATVLNDYDENDNTITFRTDKFSTYAIAYKDKAEAAGTVNGGTEGNPYTGGVSNQTKFLIAGCISLFIFVMLCLFTGKNGMTEEEKEQKFSKLIAWGKKGGKVRAAVALALVFLLLSFYYGIGMKKTAK